MKRGENLFQRFAREGSMADAYPGQPLIEILGSCRVLIEGHRGVREYAAERIQVGIKGGCVVVTGTNLELRCMTREQLVIFGCIAGVEVKRREGK